MTETHPLRLVLLEVVRHLGSARDTLASAMLTYHGAHQSDCHGMCGEINELKKRVRLAICATPLTDRERCPECKALMSYSGECDDCQMHAEAMRDAQKAE